MSQIWNRDARLGYHEAVDDDSEMPSGWRDEMDARVQRRERGETRSYSQEEVMAELEAAIA